MRTGIYVYSSTATFTIDQPITVCPIVGSVVSQSGSQVTLSKGVYKTPSWVQPLGTSDHDLVVVADDKDPWPDPPPRFWREVPDMPSQQLTSFFPQGFGGLSAASDATIACTDADWPEIQDVLSRAGFTSTRAA